MSLLRKDQSALFLSSAFRSLGVFAHDLRKTLFIYKNPAFLGDMLFEVLRYAYVGPYLPYPTCDVQ